jgi:hypothetical protein
VDIWDLSMADYGKLWNSNNFLWRKIFENFVNLAESGIFWQKQQLQQYLGWAWMAHQKWGIVKSAGGLTMG